ncbi:MAG: A/G-specific adenine glycosylase [Planctomycetes bacterium]|nr:A/G-specific adenine glycosylase [Planctomycetota bacterium]
MPQGSRRAVPNPSTSQPPNLSALLAAWFVANARDLPWRFERSPYRTLVSELMLQQTTVKTVVPRFERFVARFRGVASLAASTEQDVVEEWAGLGYYSRARNLHRAARIMVERHGGEVPRTAEELRALPGIGAYTAGAILSIAHGVRAACVDGNVRRVISRLDGRDYGARELEARAAELVPESGPGVWNEGLMELGATVCLPRDPACLLCPLGKVCRARAEGTVGQLPAAKARPATVAQEASYALILKDGSALLGRRPPGPLGGLWEFPGDRVPKTKLRETLREKLGVAAKIGAAVATARHSITHHRIAASLFAARLSAAPLARGYDGLNWVRMESLAGLPLTAAAKKLSSALLTSAPLQTPP